MPLISLSILLNLKFLIHFKLEINTEVRKTPVYICTVLNLTYPYLGKITHHNLQSTYLCVLVSSEELITAHLQLRVMMRILRLF